MPNVSIARSLVGTTTFSYDLRGRQYKVDKAIGFNTYTTQYGHDSLDRVTSMTYPNGEYVVFTYNAQGLLNAVNNNIGSSYVSNLDYNALGQVTSKTAGNGKVTTYDYYPDSQRLRNLATPGLQNLTYSYDNAGNLSSTVSTVQAGGSQGFGYDALNRLTSASSFVSGTVPGYYHIYTYDAIGNLKSGDGKTFTFPAAGGNPRPHAATSDGTCSFTYDNNGNLATRTCGTTVRTFTWDYDNHLIGIKDGSTVVASFSYDYTGARMLHVEGGNSIVTPFPHYRLVNGAATKYYFANGQRIAERDSAGAVFYYHPDHLGSTNSVTDSSGIEVRAEINYPYGRARAAGGTKVVAYGYTGQERDTATGLYYYGARYYDPAAMRFISADSINPNVVDPQTLNRYAYTRGNPVRYIDPKGRSSVPFDWNSTLLTSGDSTQFSFNTSYNSSGFGNYASSFSTLGAGSFTGAPSFSPYNIPTQPTQASPSGSVFSTYLDFAGRAVGGAGVGAGVAEIKYFNNTSWLADTGERYSRGFHGNQYVGGWNEARAISDTARDFGSKTFYVGSLVSAGQAYEAYDVGDTFGLTKSSLDLSVGGAAWAIGGKTGFGLGLFYYTADMLLHSEDAY